MHHAHFEGPAPISQLKPALGHQAGGALFYNGSDGSKLDFTLGSVVGNTVSFDAASQIKSGLGGAPASLETSLSSSC